MGKTSGKKKIRERHGERGRPSPARREPRARGVARLRSPLDGLLHLQVPDEPVWRHFWPVLALAFAARAAIALSGDFILHPDEIMQLLEQGHRLAFGNGVIYWEFFYGARSWLLPGLIAGVLKLFDALGLGQPAWYVNGIKLTFCAVSLVIPAGMYCFSRRHFGEPAARVALLAGAFWYELAGFAHKPLTGLVATSVLMALLALCVRPPVCAEAGVRKRLATAWLIAFLAVLATTIRMQYAPFALALLGLFFLRAGPEAGGGKGVTGARVHLTLAAAVFFLAVGAFDAVTWNAGWFHSYLANVHFNFELRQTSASGDSPASQYLWWLMITGAGLSVLIVAVALHDLRRYGFLLMLIALILVIHSAQAHKEYRYIFAVIPLWLLVGAGLVAQLAAGVGRPAWVYGASGVAFAAVSLAGILNALPSQREVYESTHTPKETVVRFIRGQDPRFAAYRYLAAAPGVLGVWQTDRHYHSLPGYYYLHRTIPLYDASTGPANNLHKNLKTLQASVSHIVSGDPKLAVPGYAVEKEFGHVRVLRRKENDAPVRQWQDLTPIMAGELTDRIMRKMDAVFPPLPVNAGIRFVESERSDMSPANRSTNQELP